MKTFLLKIYKILPISLRWLITSTLHQKFLVGVVAFVIKDNKILLVKNSYHNSWSLPGGYLNKGEGIEEAIKREIQEEVGLKISVVKLLGFEIVGQHAEYDAIVFCKVTGGKLKIDEIEVEKAQFFTRTELKNIDILDLHQPFLMLLKTFNLREVS